jgi:hypothetical protein
MEQDQIPSREKGGYEKTLVEVAAEETQRCAEDPNIAAVGFGLKFVGGKPQIRAALQYHVLRKLGGDKDIAAAGSSRVPDRVGGYETDVLEVEIGRPATCPGSNSPTGERGGRREDPLVGGTSTTALSDFHSIPTGYGTLGGLCFDSATGDAMALSNAHVYGDDVDSDVIQPWLPGEEYLEATLEYLFCGGPLAHLFFWTAPSPLTGILTTAAAGAWVAAVASDAEDPSRWGQRVGAVPPAGVRTDREEIHLEAVPPRLPFPGRRWKTDTTWKYERHTTAGSTSEGTAVSRENEHVLFGKRVFTDWPVYKPGARVKICAQIFSRRDTPAERFVTATCFPLADPERSVQRVLHAGDAVCARIDKKFPDIFPTVCHRGFTPQVDGVNQMVFPIVAPKFFFASDAGASRLHPAGDAANPSSLNALWIPDPKPLWITCPPSTQAEVSVYHFNDPVTVRAFAANGDVVDQATSGPERGVVHTLELKGLEIVRLEVSGGGGEGFLSEVCVNKWPVHVPGRIVREGWYSGHFDLRSAEPEGQWAVVVVSQTLDDTPTGGDPVQAARRLGGIVDSANVVETEFCVCNLLHDHTFRVASATIE